MKKLLFISLIFICSLSFGQTKHLIKNNEIITSGRIPTTFTRATGVMVFGYNNLNDSVHYNDGWRDELRPSITATQRYGQRYFNQSIDKVTWEVVNKTPQELAAEKEQELQAKEQQFEPEVVKRLLQKVTKPLLESDSITEQDIQDLAILYPQYRVGKSYAAGEVFAIDSDLFKVIQAHTSQADWNPQTTPALYVKYTPPGQVAVWVQPTGAHDAYNIGDKVLFNGSTYESLINANVWSPTAYPQGWRKI